MSKIVLVVLFVLSILLTGCGDKPSGKPEKPESAASTGSLTEFELANGIGPVKEKLTLGAIDKLKAKAGEKVFTEKCSACHKLDERYVGPAQRNVIARRSPEYILNMILNPQEMVEKHPEAKKMLAEFMTPMANQNLSMDDATKVLEYFRMVNEEKPAK